MKWPGKEQNAEGKYEEVKMKIVDCKVVIKMRETETPNRRRG